MGLTRAEMRKSFKARILTEGVMLPGAFNALAAKMAERKGFEGVYISGAAMSASVGLPDIGLLTMTEFVMLATYIVKAVNIPCICDADTGFGGIIQVARTVESFETLGLAGLHIEDQSSEKKCGHLSGKKLIPQKEMCFKINESILTRRDPNFLVIARTDARSVEGLSGAIKRANAYVEAGADLIFPEALQSKEEFETFAKEVNAPLMANMTEFGVSPLLTFDELQALGYKLVIFPVSSLRIAMKACERLYDHLLVQKSQKELVGDMQTREELYSLLGYEG